MIVRRAITILCLVVGTALFGASGLDAQQDLRFGVLGMFHPQELFLEAVTAQPLSMTGAGTPILLPGEQGRGHLSFRAQRSRVLCNGFAATRWTITARDGSSAPFTLAVPGKIRRTYRGRLTIEAHQNELIAIVTMDREDAVTAIVSSEMADTAPREALESQAVVTRSLLLAGPRHADFDFCDTTHCQFMRSPGNARQRTRDAVTATRGMILTYQGKPLAALYSSRCGGATHSLVEVGMTARDGYPYFSVACRWCRQHPMRWQSRVAPQETLPAAQDEQARIAAARARGWATVPGSSFRIEHDSLGTLLAGNSLGHGVGLCQHGAIGMALGGADVRAILAHYFPNTALQNGDR